MKKSSALHCARPHPRHVANATQKNNITRKCCALALARIPAPPGNGRLEPNVLPAVRFLCFPWTASVAHALKARWVLYRTQSSRATRLGNFTARLRNEHHNFSQNLEPSVTPSANRTNSNSNVAHIRMQKLEHPCTIS
jgi:hypothetical protein